MFSVNRIFFFLKQNGTGYVAYLQQQSSCRYCDSAIPDQSRSESRITIRIAPKCHCSVFLVRLTFDPDKCRCYIYVQWRTQRAIRPAPSGTSTGFCPPAQHFAWADGQWAMCSTQQADTRLPDLNLLLSDAFSGVKMVKTALEDEVQLRNPLRSL